jgi:hypothetical protein
MKADRFHPIMSQACADIEALGVRVSDAPVPGAPRYLPLGGRSNPRWWLIPLVSRRSAASSFALFQPQLPSARAMKGLAAVATACGVPALARRTGSWSIAGESALIRHFPEARHPVFAYFTGTAGPHRKITVQAMEADGTILGYAKSGSNPTVRNLIEREAAALELLGRMVLRSGTVPTLRFAGDVNGSCALVTDTRKTFWSGNDRVYGAVHRAFLMELFDKTRQPDAPAAQFAARFLQSWTPLRDRVDDGWRGRIDGCLQTLARHGDLPVPVCLGHGDFTPWNTCRAEGRLHVFDWEYFDRMASAGGDLIHFVHSQPHLWMAPAATKISASKRELRLLLHGASNSTVDAMHLIHALAEALRVIGKEASSPGNIRAWDGSTAQADLIDQLLANS